MRYLCLIYENEKQFETIAPAEGEAIMHEYFTFTEDIRKSGKYVAGEALQPTSTATTIRVRNGKVSTTDGPFAETKEQLGGFYLVEANDLNDAIQVASRIPSARFGAIEVRPIMDFSKAEEEFKRAEQGRRHKEGRPINPTMQTTEAVYRTESRRVLATLIRLLGDFDLAEEALQDAFAAAVEQWPRDGVPANPRAWLVSTGRFKAIDGLRRRARFDGSLAAVADRLGNGVTPPHEVDDEGVEDDRLRLIFTCCHPALPPDAQIALTLREVCGLTTEEIARAFLSPAPTLAQRIVRAKAKIKAAKIPYQVPSRADLPERLATVLHVIYLVFNEGYSASSGATLTRHDLSAEAIRLGRLLVELLPEPEAVGLLALMLLQDSRRQARTTADGEVVLLDDQDRSLWNREQIAEGMALVERAFRSRQIGPYTIQAAIAAVHANSATAAKTDWGEIVGLYDVLLKADPSPVVELNRAAAVAMRDGPEAGLVLVDGILRRGELADYSLTHSARGELCRLLGRRADAIEAYQRALGLARQEPQRRFIEQRLSELRFRA